MNKSYRIIKNKLGKYIPQEHAGIGSSVWHPLIFNNDGIVEFDTFEQAEQEIKRRQYEVVATYD